MSCIPQRRRVIRPFRRAAVLAAAHLAVCADGAVATEAPATEVSGVFEPRWPTEDGGFFVTLRAGVALSPGERERGFGVVQLGVPLDAWGAGSRIAMSQATEEPDAAPRHGSPVAAPPAPALPTPDVPAPLASQGASPRDGLALTPRLARAAVNAALRQLGSLRELGRLDGMASRSRAAASLPEVRLGAGSSRDESLRLTPTLNDPARFTRDGGRDLWFEARLTWRLDRALFSDDEIAIERLKAQHREDRARVTREVLDALVDWQRARLRLAEHPLLPEERSAAELAELGAVARLDVVTAGWFSRRLELAAGPGRH